jgi:hypothetical protein
MKIGQAKIIKKRVYFVRGKGFQYYFDLSPWNGGYLKTTTSPGAIHLHDNIIADIRTGEVYTDDRFPQ